MRIPVANAFLGPAGAIVVFMHMAASTSCPNKLGPDVTACRQEPAALVLPALQVLILLPMRNAALRVVSRLVQLAQKENRNDSVLHKQRFLREFGPQVRLLHQLSWHPCICGCLRSCSKDCFGQRRASRKAFHRQLQHKGLVDRLGSSPACLQCTKEVESKCCSIKLICLTKHG